MVGDRTEDSVLAGDLRFACPRTEWDTVGKAGNYFYEQRGRTDQDRVELNIKLRIGDCVGSNSTECREEWEKACRSCRVFQEGGSALHTGAFL